MSAPRRILVVEDEADISELVTIHLEGAGLTVQVAEDGETALRLVRELRPDLVVLDVMIPLLDGMEVCRLVRADPDLAATPIVMLTARDTEIDKILGLEMGADDYLTKPFSPRELVARVRALLRRAYGNETAKRRNVWERGWLRVDLDGYEVFLAGKRADLSLREFELLSFFVQSPNRTYSRLEILDLVWGEDTHVEPRTVDVHVRRLRQRIERDDARPELIQTVRGIGYKFKPDVLDETA